MIKKIILIIRQIAPTTINAIAKNVFLPPKMLEVLNTSDFEPLKASEL